MRAWPAALFVFVVLGACKFDHGQANGGDDDSGGPLAFAVTPAIAGPGELVALDGALGSGPVTLQFAGGATAEAAGGEHVIVTVPASAGTGAIELVDAIGSNRNVALRGATFPVHVGVFFEDEMQTDFARVSAALPMPIAHAGVVANQHWLFVVGGEDMTGAPQSSVLRARINADGSLSAFEVAGTLGVARAGPAVALAGSRVLVAGGRDGSGALASTETATIAADGTLAAFAPGPPLPEPRAYARAAIVGAALVVAGGESSAGGVTTDVYRAPLARDATLQDFAAISALQSARSRFGFVVVRSQLVALGGRGLGGSAITMVETAAIAADGTIGAFAVAPPLVFGRTGFGAFVAGDELCVAGGERSETECAIVDAQGVPSGFAVRAKLPGLRGGTQAVLAPDRVWLVGGERAPLAFAAVDRGALPGAFSPGVPLAVPARDVACAVVGDYVYVLGGIDAGNVATTTIQRARIDETGVIGEFAAYPQVLSVPRRAHQAVVLDGAIAIVGGANPGGDLASTELLAFDASGELQAPTPGRSMLVERRGARATVVNRTLYIVGGRGSTTPSRTWEEAPVTDSTIGTFVTGGTQLVRARGFYTSALLYGYFFAFGSTTETDVEASQATDVALGNFSVFAQLNAGRENHMAAYVGERLWAIGGFDSQGSVTVMEAADIGPPTLVFTVRAAPALPAALATGGCAIRLRDHLYLVGGSANSVLAPTIYSAALQ